MYTEFFHLREPPFSIAPNPRFLYPSAKHREAFAHLLYGIKEEGGGFVALTGEVGTGKTTLCRCLIEQLPENVDVALVLNPRLDAVELLATVCDELRIPYPSHAVSLKLLVDALNAYLLEAHAQGRRTVLVIDEAQNLSYEVLEQIRLLTNLETSQSKLLQIILLGQPELTRLLGQKRLRQLAQRITARYHLTPLTRTETCDYIRHRLAVSGALHPLFTRRAMRAAHRLSGGIPRLINMICDRALLGAYALGKPRVDVGIVRKAAREVFTTGWTGSIGRRVAIASVVAGVLLIAAFWWDRYQDPPATTPATTPPSRAVPAAPEPAKRPHPEAKPPAAAKQAPETLVDWLAGAGTSPNPAFGRLLALWGKPQGVPEGIDPCEFAQRHGLLCQSEDSGWNGLRLLNLAAVLELVPVDGARRYVTLIRVGPEGWTLDADGRTRTVPQADLLPWWNGRFTLLWRPPVAGVSLVKPGQASPAVPWIRQRLGLKPKRAAVDRFDEALQHQVMEFQHRAGLTVDGQVGPRTFIVLSGQGNRSDLPRLQ
ncbi:MAG TPA: AAA family ATPase [Methylococcus sp.]|nr:AAA family ATPase [Methylococcus sp.]